ncbi:unnamed protein product [Pleuronectes platessa]|uniref:Uncharacterized protein n=1 Tax=Pleuronectes platessa TaxID=8262 RepID=A0A9N7YU47_PLEPL|nr:unnamed protein product [Pleuronectes platessa]
MSSIITLTDNCIGLWCYESDSLVLVPFFMVPPDMIFECTEKRMKMLVFTIKGMMGHARMAKWRKSEQQWQRKGAACRGGLKWTSQDVDLERLACSQTIWYLPSEGRASKLSEVIMRSTSFPLSNFFSLSPSRVSRPSSTIPGPNSHSTAHSGGSSGGKLQPCITPP